MKKNILLTLSSVLLLNFSFSQINNGISDYMNMPISARATGLGNAYMAIVDDATAIRWNPGALGMLRYTSFTSSLRLGKNFSSLEENENNASDISVDTDVSSKLKAGLNEFSVAVPIPFDDFSDFYVVPSFSYNESFNRTSFEEEWLIEESDSYGNSSENLIIDQQTGSYKYLSFGLGIGIGDYIGFGMVYNRHIGEVERDLEYQYNSSFDSPQVQTEAISQKYSGGSIVFGFRASTNPASDYKVETYYGYGEGVDFGLSVTLPHQLKNKISGKFSNENFNDNYKQIQFRSEPVRIAGGIGFRLSDNLISFDANFANYKEDFIVRTNSISDLESLNITPYESQFDNIASFAIGIEHLQMLRAGVLFRNYQYRTQDEESQPWTTALSGGFSVELAEYVFWDTSVQFEFFKVEDMLNISNGSLDYRGSSFNLFTTLRVLLPY